MEKRWSKNSAFTVFEWMGEIRMFEMADIPVATDACYEYASTIWSVISYLI